MRSPTLIRWGGFAPMVDGVCWLIYALILQQFDPSYYHPTAPVDYLAVALYSVGLLLLALAIAAIHARQAAYAGPE